ncbi:MAG: hypothetical protein J1E63_08900 [Muribaculaceae bacterium]|nr:hypothetical protein [Muribaculaceae bacterium]
MEKTIETENALNDVAVEAVTVAEDVAGPGEADIDTAEPIENSEATAAPTIDIIALTRRDARIGHLLVDIIAGMDADRAVATHFTAATSATADADIAEAEQRGYLKARNELLGEKMQQSGLWQMPAAGDINADEPELDLLNYIRPSIWD